MHSIRVTRTQTLEADHRTNTRFQALMKSIGTGYLTFQGALSS